MRVTKARPTCNRPNYFLSKTETKILICHTEILTFRFIACALQVTFIPIK